MNYKILLLVISSVMSNYAFSNVATPQTNNDLEVSQPGSCCLLFTGKTVRRVDLGQICQNSISDLSTKAVVIDRIDKPKVLEDYCTQFSWSNRNNVLMGKLMGCGIKSIITIKMSVMPKDDFSDKLKNIYRCGFTLPEYNLDSVVRIQ